MPVTATAFRSAPTGATVTLAIIFGLICLLLPYFSGETRNKALLLSPVAFAGWFGVFYVILFKVSLTSDIATQWTPYLQGGTLFERALPAYIAFCGSAIVAQLLIMAKPPEARKIPNNSAYLPEYIPILLLGTSFAVAIAMWNASYLIISMDARSGNAEPISSKYLLGAVDLAIPALSLLLLRNKSGALRTALLVSAIVLIAMMFILFGSRYRLAMLATLIIFSATLNKGTLSRSGYIAIGLMLLMALPVMSLGRSYRSGFDLATVLGASSRDAVERVMNEGNIMLAMGAVSNYVPARAPYEPLSPLLVAATAPIPRELWKEKPEPDYLMVIPNSLGSSALSSSGAALPIFGEWYLMGGLPAIVIIGVVFFFLLQRQFYRALVNRITPVAACVASFCAYAYTRGYLAQTITAYVFIVLPVMLALNRKRGTRVKTLGTRTI